MRESMEIYPRTAVALPLDRGLGGCRGIYIT
jgi:hypothetical protein